MRDAASAMLALCSLRRSLGRAVVRVSSTSRNSILVSSMLIVLRRLPCLLSPNPTTSLSDS